MKTTIQLNGHTLERLKMQKQHERESYDFVLNRILDESGEDVLSEGEIEEIKEALEEVRRGEVYSIEEVAKEMGIILR